jgi:hypothetical protein
MPLRISADGLLLGGEPPGREPPMLTAFDPLEAPDLATVRNAGLDRRRQRALRPVFAAR